MSFNIEWAMAMDDTLVNLFKLHDFLIKMIKLFEYIKSECKKKIAMKISGGQLPPPPLRTALNTINAVSFHYLWYGTKI